MPLNVTRKQKHQDASRSWNQDLRVSGQPVQTDCCVENNSCTPDPKSILSSICRTSSDTSFYQQILQSLSRSDSLCSCDAKETPFGTHGLFPTQLCIFREALDTSPSPSKLLSEHKPRGLHRHFDCIWLWNSFPTGFTAAGFHVAPLEMLSAKWISR